MRTHLTDRIANITRSFLWWMPVRYLGAQTKMIGFSASMLLAIIIAAQAVVGVEIQNLTDDALAKARLYELRSARITLNREKYIGVRSLLDEIDARPGDFEALLPALRIEVRKLITAHYTSQRVPVKEIDLKNDWDALLQVSSYREFIHWKARVGGSLDWVWFKDEVALVSTISTNPNRRIDAPLARMRALWKLLMVSALVASVTLAWAQFPFSAQNKRTTTRARK